MQGLHPCHRRIGLVIPGELPQPLVSDGGARALRDLSKGNICARQEVACRAEQVSHGTRL